ncbi:hypothetical protein ACOSQ2_016116 [Xanthoceras sorbifolium]
MHLKLTQIKEKLKDNFQEVGPWVFIPVFGPLSLTPSGSFVSVLLGGAFFLLIELIIWNLRLALVAKVAV